MSERTCFVVMPIKKLGSPEHSHFRAVFNNIKQIVEKTGYSVIRADDVQRSGAITKDIVSRLAVSDLVIADLTDLNPNVFYELGVRHALRGKGTVMILDEKRTPEIPFDLSAYRVIKFVGDLPGIESLTQALTQFLAEENVEDVTRRDNPVHDWFPTLPLNVLDASAQSSTAPLRNTIKDLQSRMAQYEKAFGVDLPSPHTDRTPLSTVLGALSDAQDGLLPTTVIDEARKAFETRDIVSFLQKIRVVMERSVRLPSSIFMALASWADVLDLDEVVKAIFDQALQFYPSETNVKRAYLSVLAHSGAPADRERARKEIPGELSIDITGEAVKTKRPERLDGDIFLVGILLDAYHRDQLHAQALTFAQKLVKAFPQRTMILRNYARALEHNGHIDEAMKYYRDAIFAPDVDDTSAIWLGNELHNQSKHFDAAESYAYGCLLDPSGAANFAHLAEELSICVKENLLPIKQVSSGNRAIDQIKPQEIVGLADCAASCPNMDTETSNRLRSALERLELHPGNPNSSLSRPERVQYVKQIHEILRTDLTTYGAIYDFAAQQEDADG